MIDWDHWRTVLAVFRTGTYTGAARMLRLDATTVGRRVKSLEQRLGHRLFIRDGDRFYPTRECEPLLAHLESAAEALRDAEQSNPVPEQGAIWRDMRMTAPPFLISNLFAPAVGRLAPRRRIRVELVGTASKAGCSGVRRISPSGSRTGPEKFPIMTPESRQSRLVFCNTGFTGRFRSAVMTCHGPDCWRAMCVRAAKR